MRKKLTLLVIAMLFTGSLISCAATLSGKKFDHTAVPKIEKGKSNQEDIRKLFGEPLNTRKTETGEVWNYFYSASGIVTNPSRSLDIDFDKSGIVKDYKYKVDQNLF